MDKYQDIEEVWIVQGLSYVFLTKLDAERAAREEYSAEPVEKRYSRITVKEVYKFK